MAGYINTKTSIQGLSSAYIEFRNSIYSNVPPMSEYDLLGYNGDSDNKDLIKLAIIVFLLKNSLSSFVAYSVITNKIVSQILRDYKKIYKGDWKKELDEIKKLIEQDKLANIGIYTNNSEIIKQNAYSNIANKVAAAYLVYKSIDKVNNMLYNQKLRNKSVVYSAGLVVPNEVLRLNETIRTGKLLTYNDVIGDDYKPKKQIISKTDRWNKVKWVTYTHTDFPCYSVNGEIRHIGRKFSNGYYSPPVHPGCYCHIIPN